MCYNCGCRMSADSHGNPANITDEDFQEAAKAVNESPEEAMRNTLELLKEKLGQA